jgi:hypothetical protein
VHAPCTVTEHYSRDPDIISVGFPSSVLQVSGQILSEVSSKPENLEPSFLAEKFVFCQVVSRAVLISPL